MAGQGSEEGLRFAVLGPVQAWRDGTELDLGTPLQRSILAMLLLREGRAVTPSEMIDAVWGEEAPPRALGALRTYVSRLRAVLEPDRSPRSRPELLTSVGRGYALRVAEGSLDLARFERSVGTAELARRGGDLVSAAASLRRALDLCGGEPLAGAVGPYADHQRDRLVERRISVVETLMDIDLELGRHTEVVSELLMLTAEHPLRERLRAQLMRALYRCGRQAEALAVFTDTRQALIEELGIEPGPELTSLHQRILSADPTLTPREPVRQEPPEPPTPHASTAPPAAGQGAQPPRGETDGLGMPDMPKPAQLPAAVNDFTGRQTLINRLRAMLSSGGAEGVPIAAISGIGGVGKTTLAVHVAHMVHSLFPDGQLYADLRGYTPEPAAPESVLGGFLRALGMPADLVPDGPAERSALFRSLLADRRMLLLLDNAQDAAQVGMLLPGTPGCAAIVTSRGKLADLTSARLVDLDVMESEEALALFSAVAGPERVAAEQAAAMDAVAACGFLPLAVRILAARLAARPSWTVASLLGRLADERRRLDEFRVGNLAVDATFALGYGQLDAVQARAFRLLSLPDGPDISVAAAAAALSLSELDAEDVLESLVDTSLLEAPAPGRYRFHDLLKLFARRKAEDTETPEAVRQAMEGLLGYYLASARSAHRLAYEGSMIASRLVATGTGRAFTSADESVAWLTAESDSLFAAIAYSAAAATMSEGLLPTADLLLAMEPLLESGTHMHEFDKHARQVLAAALRIGAPASELRTRYVLGRVLFGANRLDEADEQFQAAYELSLTTGGRGGGGDDGDGGDGDGGGDGIVLGEVLSAMAVVAGRQRRHNEALGLFDRAAAAYREQGAPAGEALVLSYSVRDHLGLGRAEEAIAAAERGLAIFTELGSGAGTARARYHLGIVLSRVGRLNEAVHHHAECLAFFRAGNQRVWEQRVCFRLAETFLAAERYGDAVRHAEEALTVSREIGHPYGEAQALGVLGRALAGLGSRSRSRDCLRRAHDIFARIGAPEAEDLSVLLNLGVGGRDPV
ncbi:DNA-binding transcriptional activator of the SARP family [Sinosporangium album]|uniref:DNA-binding transcriptional activator of the SARP family n=1 Tax=Sinosporangium album TaxID=504805 RepID=A0A1G8FG18_9ACTN|nr:AfsR/SARP family transcriptional regulator [Sinosporangium album]SDH81087.1 DNA-binding transcriptional activator of the SARP family [Sinosporangium album]